MMPPIPDLKLTATAETGDINQSFNTGGNSFGGGYESKETKYIKYGLMAVVALAGMYLYFK